MLCAGKIAPHIRQISVGLRRCCRESDTIISQSMRAAKCFINSFELWLVLQSGDREGRAANQTPTILFLLVEDFDGDISGDQPRVMAADTCGISRERHYESSAVA